MHRFFISTIEDPTLQPGVSVLLPDAVARQARSVLHLVPGEQVILLDNSGDELVGQITNSSKSGVEVTIEQRRRGLDASPVRIVLCQGLMKSARFEWVLEKGTELGVDTFIPIRTHRSTAGLEEVGASKIQRWLRIIQEAAEQCGRAILPRLDPVCSLTQLLQELSQDVLAVMPWEEEQAQNIRALLEAEEIQQRVQSGQRLTVMLFIGPEGGITTTEVELARSRNVQVVTLGPRIFRAETAALVTVAQVQYALGFSAS